MLCKLLALLYTRHDMTGDRHAYTTRCQYTLVAKLCTELNSKIASLHAEE